MTFPVACALPRGRVYLCKNSKFSVYHLNYTIINTYQSVKLLILNFCHQQISTIYTETTKTAFRVFVNKKIFRNFNQKKGDGFDDEQDGDLGGSTFVVDGFVEI